MNACKQNPEGLLLLAAGCALLFRTGTSRATQRTYRNESYAGEEAEHRGSSRNDWERPEGISRAAQNAARYASDMREAVSETARSYASAAGEYAHQASQTVTGQSGRIARQTQSTIERIVREQPLVVAAAGMAAGAALAAAFPVTRIERERLGPAGQRLSEAASEAREKLSEAAAAAGDRFKNIAEERGMSAEGLKEVGREVAGTFEKSLSGAARGDDRTGVNKDMRSASGGSASYGTGATRTGTAAESSGQGASSATGAPRAPNPSTTRNAG
jgi:hypothetical protein